MSINCEGTKVYEREVRWVFPLGDNQPVFDEESLATGVPQERELFEWGFSNAVLNQ